MNIELDFVSSVFTWFKQTQTPVLNDSAAFKYCSNMQNPKAHLTWLLTKSIAWVKSDTTYIAYRLKHVYSYIKNILQFNNALQKEEAADN